ncbi:MAG: hypothetical protein IPM36_09665 [Lewinellaceae bacterium]|nr:hypothetical protein [Lewinellaceae bacterium]
MRNDLPTCTGTPETGTNLTHDPVNPLNTIALPVSDVHGPAVVFSWGGKIGLFLFALIFCGQVAVAQNVTNLTTTLMFTALMRL